MKKNTYVNSIIEQITNIDRPSDKELSEWSANNMAFSGSPIPPTQLKSSIQFLEGVCSISSFLLPAYYSFFATSINASKATSIEGYPGAVFQSYTNQSALNYISLASRKLFDHEPKKHHLRLNGIKFAQSLDNTLEEHAKYWSKLSGKSEQEAVITLKLLQKFFKICSKTDKALLKENSRLCKRISRVKQYANRSAAHLTSESYKVDWLDVLHITASVVLIAEIIRSFHRPDLGENYYQEVNEAAFIAVKQLYQEILPFKLFKKIEISQLAKRCVEKGENYSMELLLESLPDKLSYYWEFSPNI